MGKPYAATGGKPVFHEIMTPIGTIVHLYHDKPQLKTKDQYGKIPDIDPDTGIQNAEYKATMAWRKERVAELQGIVNEALAVKLEGWPETANPNAFFALEPFMRDGDNPAHNTKGKDYLKGHYYLNFKSKAKAERNAAGQVVYSGAPGLLGPYGPGNVIMPADIWQGCEGRVSGIMFATEYMGKHFISTRLNNIQLFKTGERIGGGARPTADSQFGALIDPGTQLGGAGFGSLGTGAMPAQNYAADPFGLGKFGL